MILLGRLSRSVSPLRRPTPAHGPVPSRLPAPPFPRNAAKLKSSTVTKSPPTAPPRDTNPPTVLRLSGSFTLSVLLPNSYNCKGLFPSVLNFFPYYVILGGGKRGNSQKNLLHCREENFSSRISSSLGRIFRFLRFLSTTCHSLISFMSPI